jgi:hypothetical protein
MVCWWLAYFTLGITNPTLRLAQLSAEPHSVLLLPVLSSESPCFKPPKIVFVSRVAIAQVN